MRGINTSSKQDAADGLHQKGGQNGRLYSIPLLLCLVFFSYCGSGPFVVSGNADTPEEAYARGKRLFEAGAYDRAIIEFERARALDTDYAPAYEGLSRVALARGEEDEAIRLIRTAKIKDIQYVPAWIGTGLLYVSVKRYRDAVMEFQEALRRDPDRIWAATTYFHLAQTYEQMGEVEQAYEAYRSVIALDALHLEAREALERVKKSLKPGYLNNPWR